MRKLFIMLVGVGLVSAVLLADDYYSGVIWSEKPTAGYLIGARQFPGKEKEVEILIREDKPKGTNIVQTDLLYLRKFPSGDFRLYTTNGVEIKRRSIGNRYATMVTPIKISSGNLDRFFRVIFSDRRGVHLFRLEIPQVFDIKTKGEYVLSITPHVWKMTNDWGATSLVLSPVKIPIKFTEN